MTNDDAQVSGAGGYAEVNGLETLERVGHETPPRAVWDVVVPAILRNTSGGRIGDERSRPDGVTGEEAQ